MYTVFLSLHNILRWFVLASMLYAIFSSIHGLLTHRSYTKLDNLMRILANTFGHTQLLIGFVLYFSLSPITAYFLQNGATGSEQISFFGIWHAVTMFLAVVAMTIGGALAKRAKTDRSKFRYVLTWFLIALTMIIFAIPWFRPWFRGF